jgi:hypothetical protein
MNVQQAWRRLAIPCLLGLGVAGSAQAQNPVVDWDRITADTVIGVAKKGPPVAPVYFAYVGVAMFDAANSIDRRYRPFAVAVPAPAGASVDAAVVAVAHDVLVHYFPAQKAALDAAEAASLAALPADAATAAGVEVGRTVGAQWLALRANDGLEAPVPFVPGQGPGQWQPVPTYPAPGPNTPPPPAAPWLASFKPFALRSADQFLGRVPAPYDLASKAWARDFERTKAYGTLNGSLRTPWQTGVGRFWADHTTAQYSRAFRQLVASRNLGTADAARLAAVQNVVAADSIAACMSAKYHFAFWRPYTAIHDADTDGNPATVADPDWIPLAPTPGHPEYPANHGCLTEAVMDAFTAFFDTDEVPYVVTSNVTGTTHSFATFGDVVDEVNDARIYGGMHFRHSVEVGNRLGRWVADYVMARKFKPADDDGRAKE